MLGWVAASGQSISTPCCLLQLFLPDATSLLVSGIAKRDYANADIPMLPANGGEDYTRLCDASLHHFDDHRHGTAIP